MMLNFNSININFDIPDIEGKSKKFFRLHDKEFLETLGLLDELNNRIIYFMVFKPHLRSITSEREENIAGTDIERLKANLIFNRFLMKAGIRTHILYPEVVRINGVNGLIVAGTETIPIEFIARFYAAGSIVRMFPSIVKPGMKFIRPLYKYDLKQDVSVSGVDDPMLNESYIVGLGLLDRDEFERAKILLQMISNSLNNYLDSKGIKLVDMKMEFGFELDNNGNRTGHILLIDEISQDCIRAEDKGTGESLTKDVFRNMKSDEEVLRVYQEFNSRIGAD